MRKTQVDQPIEPAFSGSQLVRLATPLEGRGSLRELTRLAANPAPQLTAHNSRRGALGAIPRRLVPKPSICRVTRTRCTRLGAPSDRFRFDTQLFRAWEPPSLLLAIAEGEHTGSSCSNGHRQGARARRSGDVRDGCPGSQPTPGEPPVDERISRQRSGCHPR